MSGGRGDFMVFGQRTVYTRKPHPRGTIVSIQARIMILSWGWEAFRDKRTDYHSPSGEDTGAA